LWFSICGHTGIIVCPCLLSFCHVYFLPDNRNKTGEYADYVLTQTAYRTGALEHYSKDGSGQINLFLNAKSFLTLIVISLWELDQVWFNLFIEKSIITFFYQKKSMVQSLY
jgi:hypothetical protein